MASNHGVKKKRETKAMLKRVHTCPHCSKKLFAKWRFNKHLLEVHRETAPIGRPKAKICPIPLRKDRLRPLKFALTGNT